MNANEGLFRPEESPEHESALRRMIGDATNSPYQALHSLAEAQAVPDGVVVFEGDYGGQIYVVAPAREVHCSEEVLAQLLTDIDAAEWADEDGARVYYERHAIGVGVSGGMGGGNVEAHVWVHPKLRVPRTAILKESRVI